MCGWNCPHPCSSLPNWVKGTTGVIKVGRRDLDELSAIFKRIREAKESASQREL